MNRKLHNSLMALSTTGLLFVIGLMAANPLAHVAGYEMSAVARADAAMVAAAARADAMERRAEARADAAIAARAKAFEEELGSVRDAQQAIAATAAFAAAAATEAALAAALAEVEAAESESDPDRTGTSERTEAPARKRRNARSALALPYFSFARGLRGGNGS